MSTEKAKPSTSVSAKRSAKQRREAERRRRQQQQQTLLIIGAVAVVGVVLIAILVSGRPVEAVIPAGAGEAYVDIPAEYFGQTEDGFYFIGAPDAPVVIEDFSSFSCSACRSYHSSYFRPILDKIRNGDVRFVYIPLTTFGSFESSNMSRAAICAGDQGRFWQMADVLFDWQGRYGITANDPRRLSAAAEQLGLDVARFDSCFGSAETTAILDRASSARAARNVDSTPSVFLDGARIYPQTDDGGNGPTLAELRGIIESRVRQEG